MFIDWYTSPKPLRFTTSTLLAFKPKDQCKSLWCHICPRQVEPKSHGLMTYVQEIQCVPSMIPTFTTAADPI